MFAGGGQVCQCRDELLYSPARSSWEKQIDAPRRVLDLFPEILTPTEWVLQPLRQVRSAVRMARVADRPPVLIDRGRLGTLSRPIRWARRDHFGELRVQSGARLAEHFEIEGLLFGIPIRKVGWKRNYL